MLRSPNSGWVSFSRAFALVVTKNEQRFLRVDFRLSSIENSRVLAFRPPRRIPQWLLLPLLVSRPHNFDDSFAWRRNMKINIDPVLSRRITLALAKITPAQQ